MPGWERPSSGPITCTMPWRAAAHAVVAGCRTRRSCARAPATCSRERWSAIASSAVRSRGIGGDVVVGGRERAVGPAHLAAREPQPLERLRGGHLVDEVEVDVEQRRAALPLGRRAPRAPPRSSRTWSWASAILLRPAAITDMNRVSRRPGFSKWCGRSASNVTASPCARSWATPSQTSRSAPSSTTAVSRLPASWIGGSPGPPVAAPGAQRVQRHLGALAGHGRRQHLVAVAVRVAAQQPLAGAHDADAVPLVEAQQLRERELQAGGDLRRDRQGRAGLAPLDLRQHRRGHAAALGQVAQREVHPLAQRAYARADCQRLGGRGRHAAYVITYVCMQLRH